MSERAPDRPVDRRLAAARASLGGRAIGGIDSRYGLAPQLRKLLRYLFPEHWSFLLGEIALYSFGVLVATGIYLALFFEPSLAETTYTGSYDPLRGREMSEAYASTVRISFDVDAGLLMRQAHHWAANVFVVAIVLHLLRVFFTGAFRRPRDLTYYAGVTILMLALLEGFLGYSLLDDLLSGMGLAIAYGVAESIPVVGANVALLLWGAEYPGSDDFLSRVYITHVLLLPVAMAALIGLHLALVALAKHGQFRERGRTESNVVGVALWPAYALRSIGLALAVAAAIFALGGLVQINPIWLWGPYETWVGTNGAQPDWYMGWLIGALRLMPGFDLVIGDYTLIPNPFWGGVLFPLAVFAFLFAYPALERRLGGRAAERHHLLDRPRDAPRRTGIGLALLSFVAIVLVFGGSDRLALNAGVPYETQLWIARVALIAVPAAAYWLGVRICRELAASEQRPVLGEPAGRGARPPGEAPDPG